MIYGDKPEKKVKNYRQQNPLSHLQILPHLEKVNSLFYPFTQIQDKFKSSVKVQVSADWYIG